MKVARVAVRMLEAEPAFAEVDFARDARIHHPLQRAVDGGAADARPCRIAPRRRADSTQSGQIEEIVGA